MTKRTGKIGRVEIDREICIGSADCVLLASDAFALDKENKAVYLTGNKASDEALLKAAQACPVKAIYLYDQSGKQIYPPA